MENQNKTETKIHVHYCAVNNHEYDCTETECENIIDRTCDECMELISGD